jgi:hypothetical protein
MGGTTRKSCEEDQLVCQMAVDGSPGGDVSQERLRNELADGLRTAPSGAGTISPQQATSRGFPPDSQAGSRVSCGCIIGPFNGGRQPSLREILFTDLGHAFTDTTPCEMTREGDAADPDEITLGREGQGSQGMPCGRDAELDDASSAGDVTGSYHSQGHAYPHLPEQRCQDVLHVIRRGGKVLEHTSRDAGDGGCVSEAGQRQDA